MIDDDGRQEMELDIRMVYSRFTPDEGSSFKVSGRSCPRVG